MSELGQVFRFVLLGLPMRLSDEASQEPAESPYHRAGASALRQFGSRRTFFFCLIPLPAQVMSREGGGVYTLLFGRPVNLRNHTLTGSATAIVQRMHTTLQYEKVSSKVCPVSSRPSQRKACVLTCLAAAETVPRRVYYYY